MGVFAAQNMRSLSAICEEKCSLYTITRQKALELYYQNPQFGFFLIRRVSGRVVENQGLGDAAVRA